LQYKVKPGVVRQETAFMTDERTPAMDAPRQLLAGTQEFTRRVRKAQRGTWFLLVLLAVLPSP
jgi:hypothetical protein